MKSNHRRLLAIFALLLLPLLRPGATAQVLPGNDVNFAYASWLGTGAYQIAGQQAYILGGTGNLIWIEANESRKWALDILVAGSMGFYSFPDGFGDVGAVTFVPGLMLIYPVLDNWDVKPFAQVGFAHDFANNETVAVSGAGFKSLTVFSHKYGIDYELGVGFLVANNSGAQNRIEDNGFSRLELGWNTVFPTNLDMFNRETELNFFVIYTEFLNDLQYFDAGFNDQRIRRLLKIGFAMTAEEKFEILGFKFKGAGLHVQFGENYYGIGVNTGFPF